VDHLLPPWTHDLLTSQNQMVSHMIPLHTVGIAACGIQGTKDGTCICKTPPQCWNNGTYQSKHGMGQLTIQEVILSMLKGFVWV
jgi:hypothetical protein